MEGPCLAPCGNHALLERAVLPRGGRDMLERGLHPTLPLLAHLDGATLRVLPVQRPLAPPTALTIDSAAARLTDPALWATVDPFMRRKHHHRGAAARAAAASASSAGSPSPQKPPPAQQRQQSQQPQQPQQQHKIVDWAWSLDSSDGCLGAAIALLAVLTSDGCVSIWQVHVPGAIVAAATAAGSGGSGHAVDDPLSSIKLATAALPHQPLPHHISFQPPPPPAATAAASARPPRGKRSEPRLALWGAFGVELHSAAGLIEAAARAMDASGGYAGTPAALGAAADAALQLPPPLAEAAPPTRVPRRVCGAFTPGGALAAMSSGGEALLCALPAAGGGGGWQAPPAATAAHALCVEAALRSSGSGNGGGVRVVVGTMRTMVACGADGFVGATSGGLDIGDSGAAAAVSIGLAGAGITTRVGASPSRRRGSPGKAAHSPQPPPPPPVVSAPAPAAMAVEGMVTITARPTHDPLRILSLNGDGGGGGSGSGGLMGLLGSAGGGDGVSGGALAADAVDRRPRLVLMGLRSDAADTTAAQTAVAAAPPRLTLLSSPPLPAALSTPDLLAASADGTLVAVGSHACARVTVLRRRQRHPHAHHGDAPAAAAHKGGDATSDEGALHPVATLVVPGGGRPRGLAFERCAASNGPRVLVLAAWDASGGGSSGEAGAVPAPPAVGMGSVTCRTQLLAFDIPPGAAGDGSNATASANDSGMAALAASVRRRDTAAAAAAAGAGGRGRANGGAPADGGQGGVTSGGRGGNGGSGDGSEAILRALRRMESTLALRLDALEATVAAQGERLERVEGMLTRHLRADRGDY